MAGFMPAGGWAPRHVNNQRRFHAPGCPVDGGPGGRHRPDCAKCSSTVEDRIEDLTGRLDKFDRTGGRS